MSLAPKQSLAAPKESQIRDQIVARKRFSKGGYEDGYYVDGEEEFTPGIEVSVQPPNRKGSKRIQHLPGGERVEDWIVVYADPNTFRGQKEKEGVIADRIIYQGDEYQVAFVNDYNTPSTIPHDEVFCQRYNESAC